MSKRELLAALDKEEQNIKRMFGGINEYAQILLTLQESTKTAAKAVRLAWYQCEQAGWREKSALDQKAYESPPVEKRVSDPNVGSCISAFAAYSALTQER